tara:strand:- start:355 stop:471 length:117 start_codon:yes stop_codon:yes gene_type:complete
MWNGAAPNLKARLIKINVKENIKPNTLMSSSISDKFKN